MKDSYKFLGRRKDLIDKIKSKGITDKDILESFLLTPRHYFVQTQLLTPKKKQKILEIGTGSGYQAAILYNMGVDVYTIERNHKLFRKTTELFKKLKIKPKIFKYGDGYKGLPNYSPFDGIIVTAGAPEVPHDLLKQLKIGGKLVIPVGGKSQIMYRITKQRDGRYKKEKFGNFRFVPLLKDKN